MPGIPGKAPKIDDVSLQDVEKVLRLRDVLDPDERLLAMKRIARRLLNIVPQLPYSTGGSTMVTYDSRSYWVVLHQTSMVGPSQRGVA